MPEKLRVIHYLNQFFGGMGAEEAAYTPVQVKEGAVGPARPMQQTLGDAATVVATIVAGDNYFVEEPESLSEAGPGYHAGYSCIELLGRLATGSARSKVAAAIVTLLAFSI